MSDPRRPYIYQCPHIETCVFPIDEGHFKSHCREYSDTPKHPQHDQCQGYKDMNDLPRNWHKRIYKQEQDAGMRSSRFRV